MAHDPKLNSKIPPGDVAEKWEDYKGHVALVAPNNKRRIDVIVVGTGLAGASAAASLVERRADPSDRRAWRVYLTASGESRLEDLKPLATELFADAVSGLNDAQQANLEAMLDTIRLNLTRKAPEAANG